MTVEERLSRAISRLAVVERVLALEGLTSADNFEPLSRGALAAGLRDLVEEVYAEIEPIEHAPDELTNWDPDEEVEPDAG